MNIIYPGLATDPITTTPDMILVPADLHTTALALADATLALKLASENRVAFHRRGEVTALGEKRDIALVNFRKVVER